MSTRCARARFGHIWEIVHELVSKYAVQFSAQLAEQLMCIRAHQSI
jgi:hypothetical protein